MDKIRKIKYDYEERKEELHIVAKRDQKELNRKRLKNQKIKREKEKIHIIKNNYLEDKKKIYETTRQQSQLNDKKIYA